MVPGKNTLNKPLSHQSMKKIAKQIIQYTSGIFLLVLAASCQPKPLTKHAFTLAQDSCFQNTLAINPDIKFGVITDDSECRQCPYIPKSKLDMTGTITDSMAFLSPNKELRITSWGTANYPGRTTDFTEVIYTYKELVKFNDYAVQMRMFLQDSTLKIVKNLMYKNCQYPHFVMWGENAEYLYLLKTELSRVSLIENRLFKCCLVRFPKKLKKKYWGTVHQMMESAGYYQSDTTALRKKVNKFIDEYGDTLRQLDKVRKKK